MVVVILHIVKYLEKKKTSLLSNTDLRENSSKFAKYEITEWL